MSLWVDKYRPKDLDKLDFHLDQSKRLKNLIKSDDFPHLLVYGPSGAGKKTRIMCLLRELYGPGVERLRIETMHLTTPSNKKLEVSTISSNYHIEINPSDVGIYDRVVVMDVIKNVAQTQQLDVNGQREFKVIILTDADQLTKDAQHALRRTMEKYVSTCRLILCANSISKLTPEIRSRVLGIRVAAPDNVEIVKILTDTCEKEGLTLPPEMARKITEKANRNLRLALLMCEACKVEQYPFGANQNVTEPDWLLFVRSMVHKIVRKQDTSVVEEVRMQLYELLICGIPTNLIFEVLLRELLKSCDNQIKPQVIEQAALYDQRIQEGNKPIIHLEAFVTRFMAIYKKFMEDAIGEF